MSFIIRNETWGWARFLPSTDMIWIQLTLNLIQCMPAILDISTLSRPTAQYFYNKARVYAIVHQLHIKSSNCYYLMQKKNYENGPNYLFVWKYRAEEPSDLLSHSGSAWHFYMSSYETQHCDISTNQKIFFHNIWLFLSPGNYKALISSLISFISFKFDCMDISSCRCMVESKEPV